MNCPRCNTPIPENMPYCPACGTPVQQGASAPQSNQYAAQYAAQSANIQQFPSSAQQAPAAQPAYPGGYPAPAPKKNIPIVKLLAIIIPAVVVVIVALILIIRGATTTSVSKFVNDDLVIDGYNGYASVSSDDVLDGEALMRSIGGTKYSNFTSDDFLSDLLDYGSRYSVMDFIDIDMDNTDHLSNGDTVIVTITVDKDGFNKTIHPKKKLVGKSTIKKEYKVEGLTDPLIIDPFSVITSVSYDLTSSYGKTTIFYNESYNETVGDYRITYVDGGYDSHSLKIIDSNLDEIGYINFSSEDEAYTSTKKITVSCRQSETEFISEGIILSPLKKEYEPATVSYVSKAEEISVDDYNQLKEDATADATGMYSDATFVESYFGKTRGSDNGDNALIFVFSYTDTWDNSTAYITCHTDELKITSDGKLVIEDNIYWRNYYEDDKNELLSRFNSDFELYSIKS